MATKLEPGDQKLKKEERNERERGSEGAGCAGINVEQLYLPRSN